MNFCQKHPSQAWGYLRRSRWWMMKNFFQLSKSYSSSKHGTKWKGLIIFREKAKTKRLPSNQLNSSCALRNGFLKIYKVYQVLKTHERYKSTNLRKTDQKVEIWFSSLCREHLLKLLLFCLFWVQPLAFLKLQNFSRISSSDSDIVLGLSRAFSVHTR